MQNRSRPCPGFCLSPAVCMCCKKPTPSAKGTGPTPVPSERACKRGKELPIRHEEPRFQTPSCAYQVVKNGFTGFTTASSGPIEGRDHHTICGRSGHTVTKTDLRSHCCLSGELLMLPGSQKQWWIHTACHKQAAGAGAAKSFNKLIVEGHRLNVKCRGFQATRGEEREGRTHRLWVS